MSPTLITLLIAPLVAALASTVINFIKVLPENAVTQLLFDGIIEQRHKTKYFLTQITDRYKESIRGFNGAMAFNIGFALIAFYAYFAIPSTGTVTIPFVSLSVTRLVWISFVPFISFMLQTFIFTSFVWFMMLRLGMRLLYEQIGATDDFGDVMNILLTGALGHIWIIFKVGEYFKLKSILTWIWYIPAVILFFVILSSPVLTCLFFIIQLFLAHSFLLGIAYALFFIFFSFLFLLLLVIVSILSIGELTIRIEIRLKNRTKLDSDQIQSFLKLLK